MPSLNLGIIYSSLERPFIEYFNRLKSIEMTISEIETKLPQLEKYYQDMVVDKWTEPYTTPRLLNLFKIWANQFE